jgi:hypothetical protein
MAKSKSARLLNDFNKIVILIPIPNKKAGLAGRSGP